MKAILYDVETENGREFEAPDPPLQVGEVLSFAGSCETMATHTFGPGDTIVLLERTDEAPFKIRCSLGNWRVRTKYAGIENTDEGIWSNIDMMVTEGSLLRRPSPTTLAPTRWERLRNS